MAAPTGAGQTIVINGETYISALRGSTWTWKLQAKSTQAAGIFSRKEKTDNLGVIPAGAYTLDLDAGAGDNKKMELQGNTTITPSSAQLRNGIFVISVKKNSFTLSWGSGLFLQQGDPAAAPNGYTTYVFARNE